MYTDCLCEARKKSEMPAVSIKTFEGEPIGWRIASTNGRATVSKPGWVFLIKWPTNTVCISLQTADYTSGSACSVVTQSKWIKENKFHSAL